MEQLDLAIAPFVEAGSDENAAGHLAEMVESDWVTADGPVYSLTERGHLAFTRLQEVVDRLREQTSDGLSPEQYDTTLAALKQMAVNLGWQD
ncbi:MAG: hypothetical protein WED09_02715 [Homoserinimonas sp.]